MKCARSIARSGRIAICAAIVSVAAGVGTARTQQAPEAGTEIPAGTAARVWQTSASPKRIAGTILQADSAALTVRPRGGQPLVLLANRVERIDIREEPRTWLQGAWHGTKRGLVGGLAATAVFVALGLAADTQPCDGCFISATGIALLLGVPLTAATTAGGTLIGAAFPGHTWTRVPLPVRTTGTSPSGEELPPLIMGVGAPAESPSPALAEPPTEPIG